MDPAYLPNDSQPARREANPALIWDILTVLTVIGLVLLVLWFALIFLQPTSSLNPFPPLELPQPLVLPSATSTVYVLPPTWTAEPSLTLTASPSPTARQMLPPTKTPVLKASATPAAGNYPFVLQSQPSYAASTLFRPESGCDWQGAAGQIFDLKNGPVLGVQIRMGGNYNNKSVSQVTLSGLARSYGESGYEFQINTQPLNSKNTLFIQLFDQADIPISPKVYFETFADCSRNLVIINFKQVK